MPPELKIREATGLSRNNSPSKENLSDFVNCFLFSIYFLFFVFQNLILSENENTMKSPKQFCFKQFIQSDIFRVGFSLVFCKLYGNFYLKWSLAKHFSLVKSMRFEVLSLIVTLTRFSWHLGEDSFGISWCGRWNSLDFSIQMNLLQARFETFKKLRQIGRDLSRQRHILSK